MAKKNAVSEADAIRSYIDTDSPKLKEEKAKAVKRDIRRREKLAGPGSHAYAIEMVRREKKREAGEVAFFAARAMDMIPRHEDREKSTWSRTVHQDKRFAKECFDLAEVMAAEFRKRRDKMLEKWK